MPRERLGMPVESAIADAISRFTSMALESVDLNDVALALESALDAAARDLELTRSIEAETRR